MKKCMIAAMALMTACAFAEESTDKKAEAPAAVEKQEAPILWGFLSYGFYSGYQLYGNLVNSDPTLQGYAELNANLPWQIGPMDDLGFFGFGVWSNTDLTDRRRNLGYMRAFNEWDPNVHWEKTFWFDDDKEWGLDYRTWFVWYIYPNSNTDTTWDWDHSFALVNPYVTPYVTWVREYSQGANLIEFGLRRPTQFGDSFSICPSANFVWREAQYVWCFPTAGFTEFADSGVATMRLQLDATYMFTSWFGLWAKVAYCCTLDSDLRDIQDHSHGNDYSRHGDFAWGGVGLCFNF